MLMTPEEQERYTQVFQDHYSHMYDWFCILSFCLYERLILNCCSQSVYD
jgi:hypothetical protein